MPSNPRRNSASSMASLHTSWGGNITRDKDRPDHSSSAAVRRKASAASASARAWASARNNSRYRWLLPWIATDKRPAVSRKMRTGPGHEAVVERNTCHHDVIVMSISVHGEISKLEMAIGHRAQVRVIEDKRCPQWRICPCVFGLDLAQEMNQRQQSQKATRPHMVSQALCLEQLFWGRTRQRSVATVHNAAAARPVNPRRQPE